MRRGLALPQERTGPVLVLVAGLPGTGKTYFSRALTAALPLVHVESDAIRRALVPRPTHQPAEHARVFQVAHRLVEDLLGQGYGVLFDATNLLEAHRARLYRIAWRLGAPVVVTWTTAPPEVVYRRMQQRRRTAGTASDADWEVYLRMRPTAQPVRGPHIVVDTSHDISPAVRRVAAAVRGALAQAAARAPAAPPHAGAAPTKEDPWTSR